MAIDSNSYASVGDVVVLTRRMLDGAPTYNADTNPTLLEVEAIIDDISSLLNDAIASHGFTVPVSTAGPKRSCDIWVRIRAAAIVELSQPNEGFSGEEGSRYASLWNLFEVEAYEWVAARADGWKTQGVATTEDASDSLVFTGLNKHSQRADPDSTVLEQPLFRRRQFWN